MNQRAVMVKWMPGFLLLLLFAVIYRSSLISMWRTWGESETYAHGYLIFPIVAFLIWRKRHVLQRTPHLPVALAPVALGGLGLLWVVGHLAHVQVVEQFLFIGMLLTLVLALYGLPFFKVILFPLFYLGFAVPMGEVFVPALMEFTADFTVAALSLSGIPVYRDGMFFTIPSGDFEVAWACSGIRYLMASFSLGTLYAYLSYRSFKKQVLFGVVSLVVPIIANAVRAYGIVIIAHLSNMKYAVGADHLVYGWLFFGIIMFLLFYIGGRFRSAEDFEEDTHESISAESTGPTTSIVLYAAIIVALAVPQAVLMGTLNAASSEIELSQLPVAAGEWRGPLAEKSYFEPELKTAENHVTARYAHTDGDIQLWVYRFRPFTDGKEMINETNRLVRRRNWRTVDQRKLERANATYLPVVNESLMRQNFTEYLVWHWYQLNDETTTSKIGGKLLEMQEWLTNGLRLNEAIVIVAAPGRGEESRALLELFMRAHGEQLNTCVFAQGEQDFCHTGPQFE
ncbi:MAG: exosortase A [Gammaproteobacteria bacterium]|nr:exosortase A [Gammaproteobacteria bacterium]